MVATDRPTFDPGAASPNKDHHESVKTYRHAPCENCGRAGYAHDRERVNTENGRYHYVYVCPGGGE